MTRVFGDTLPFGDRLRRPDRSGDAGDLDGPSNGWGEALAHIDTRLHLGLHKTASTHLQNALSRNREALARQGITYLGPKDIRSGAAGLQEAVQGGLPVLARRRLLKRLGGRGRLVASDENLIGTMEDNFLGDGDGDGDGGGPGIYRSAPARLERLIEGMGFRDVHLFVALRNPASYYSSCYRFHIQRHGFVTWSDYAARHPLRDVSWVRLIRALGAVPGVSRVTVWRMEDYPAVGRKVCAGLLGPDWADLPLGPDRANAGLSPRHVRRKYAEAGAEPDFDGSVFRPFGRRGQDRSARRYAREIARIGGMGGITVLKP